MVALELEAEDELGVVYAFVFADGGELIPENDLALPVAVGVVGLLTALGPYRGKVGD
jgi:hypothetical protein